MLFKNLFLSAFMIVGMLVVVSCEDDAETITETIDTSVPTGDLTVQRQGSFMAQSGTPTAGTAQLGTDQDGETFLRFSDDFMTALATGTVTVYFSTSDTFTPDPAGGNPDLQLVGAVQQNGERFFKLNTAPSNQFTHVILWCASANIPFGNAQLQ